ncbi:alpha/beta fold hydrolase [Modestobacter lapidis]|nr:alpha/beta fold hydrolase [Modestobacter lapidis]
MSSATPLHHVSRDVTETFVDIAGHRIRMLRAGAGPAILYLHGVGDLGGWIPPLSELAKDHLVLRPDHPGFNGSDDMSVDSPADVAAVYSRLLDELGVESATVVGCSFGGWIATELALLEPVRVSRLVLIDPAGMPAEEPRPRLSDLGAAEAVALTYFEPDVRAAATARAVRLPEDDPAAHARQVRNSRTARRLGPDLHDAGLPARVAALEQPVLVVWGEFDGIIPLSHARSWTSAIPHAELQIVPRTGHLPHVEKPTDFFARTDSVWPATARSVRRD